MYISLGNVTVSEFLRRTGYNISEEDIKLLKNHLQDNAKIDPFSDKFHIFDMPFCINVAEPFSKELISLLRRYDDLSPSKETLSISIISESEKEKQKRLKNEKEKKEWEDKKADPNSIWNVKWHMAVPVIVDGCELFYSCFINTYTTGMDNIPDTIEGKVNIRLDEEGFHGNFTLYNPEKDNDAAIHEDWRFVIGRGFISKSGSWKGSIDEAYFCDIEFSIKDAIQNYINLEGHPKEIHYDRIANRKDK